jgi:hypothetical protein
MYNSTLSSTSALDGVGGQRHAPAALPPGRTLYPLYRRLVGPQSLSGRVRKISPPNGIRSPGRPSRSKSLYRLRCSGPPALVILILSCHYTHVSKSASFLRAVSPELPVRFSSVRASCPVHPIFLDLIGLKARRLICNLRVTLQM